MTPLNKCVCVQLSVYRELLPSIGSEPSVVSKPSISRLWQSFCTFLQHFNTVKRFYYKAHYIMRIAFLVILMHSLEAKITFNRFSANAFIVFSCKFHIIFISLMIRLGLGLCQRELISRIFDLFEFKMNKWSNSLICAHTQLNLCTSFQRWLNCEFLNPFVVSKPVAMQLLQEQNFLHLQRTCVASLRSLCQTGRTSGTADAARVILRRRNSSTKEKISF